MTDNVLPQRIVLRRWQLEAHLTLHGWRPGRHIENPGRTLGRQDYLLRNHDAVVMWTMGNVSVQRESTGGPYYLNDHWQFCEWSDIPAMQLRRMAAAAKGLSS